VSLLQQTIFILKGHTIPETMLSGTRWRCSSDPKQRLTQLVQFYTNRLRTGAIQRESAAIWLGETSAAASAASEFDLAVKLAKKAFAVPHMYLVPEEEPNPPPTHALHLDILSLPHLDAILHPGRTADPDAAPPATAAAAASSSNGQEMDEVALAEALRKGAGTFDAFVLAFSDDLSAASGDLAERDGIWRFFVELSRVSEQGTREWSRLAAALAQSIEMQARPFLARDNGTTVLFDALPLPNVALLDRAVAILILSLGAVVPSEILNVVRAVRYATPSGVAGVLGRVGAATMDELVECLQNHFTRYMYENQQAALIAIAEVLQLLYRANTAVTSRGVIPFTRFYNGTAVEFNDEGIFHDYQRAAATAAPPSGVMPPQTRAIFSFSRYPCLIDVRFKSLLMQFEAYDQMQNAQRDAVLRALFRGGGNPSADAVFAMHVRRDDVIKSTINEIQRKSGQLNRPLQVHFEGEPGVDAGGVRKEFFQLITRKLLDPQFGMFAADPKSRALWFLPDKACEGREREFKLVGQILGLAVFNNVLVEATFPQALYRRMLEVEPDLEDLREVDPDLAAGLDQLLTFDEAESAATVEATFCRSFVHSFELFGQVVEEEIIPNGAHVALTGANRQQYVQALVRHVLVDRVRRNFTEFRQGFFTVASRGLVSTMHPVELEQLMCGSPTLNLKDLQRGTRYEGYAPTDPVILQFWELVTSEFTPVQQRQFLKFCTGSDRVPIGGLADLRFVVGKNGDDGELLPTAHTCFNHLLLPAYASKDKLRSKLLLAIENSEGFGLK
jgi:ubiquitin-protein ligase E3 A